MDHWFDPIHGFGYIYGLGASPEQAYCVPRYTQTNKHPYYLRYPPCCPHNDRHEPKAKTAARTTP